MDETGIAIDDAEAALLASEMRCETALDAIPECEADKATLTVAVEAFAADPPSNLTAVEPRSSRSSSIASRRSKRPAVPSRLSMQYLGPTTALTEPGEG